MTRKRSDNRYPAPISKSSAGGIDAGGRLREEIELRAYYRYCERGCAPGGDREDWLAAEQEVLAKHRAATTSKESA